MVLDWDALRRGDWRVLSNSKANSSRRCVTTSFREASWLGEETIIIPPSPPSPTPRQLWDSITSRVTSLLQRVPEGELHEELKKLNYELEQLSKTITFK